MTISLTTFIIDLFLLLAASLLAGELASRFGQPALVGQLLVGLLLGPTLIGPYIGLATLGSDFRSLQFIATVFVLFVAGLEIVPEDIYRMGLVNLGLGLLLFAGPFLLGSGVVFLLFPGLPFYTVLFVGLTLSITALPVMGIMLVQFGLADRPEGKLLMNLALINEISAVLVFAVLLQLSTGHTSGVLAVGMALGSLAGFLGVMFGLYLLITYLERTRIWGRVRVWFAAEWRSKGAGFALLMVLLIGASLFSQFLNLTYVVGAFYAGVLVTKKTAGPTAHKSISTVFDTISWGFFIPLFFAFVGVEMNLRLLGTLLLIVGFAILVLLAVSSKVAVGSFVGWVHDCSRPDMLATGFLMASRGAVELAMAVILLQAGVFNTELFTIVAGVGLVTTILSPIGALWAWRSTPASQADLYKRAPSLRTRTGRVWRPPPTEWGDLRDLYTFRAPSKTEEPSVSSPASRPPLPRERR